MEEEDQQVQQHRSFFRIDLKLHLKEVQIQDFLLEQEIDLLGLIETDLYHVDPKKPPCLPGYKTILPQHRGMNHEVRILLLVNQAILPKVIVRNDLMSSEVPSIWVTIKFDTQVVTFAVTYREWRPNRKCDLESTSNALQNFMDQVDAADKEAVIIMGDFNLCAERSQDTNHIHKHLTNLLKDRLAVGDMSSLRLD